MDNPNILLPQAWEPFFKENKTILETILNNIIQANISIVPDPNLVFDIFYRIKPSQIKIVIINQDIYHEKCPVTNQNYACGTAFAVHPKCKTIPKSLNLMSKMIFNNKYSHSPIIDKTLSSWVLQGIFPLNISLTRGVQCSSIKEIHTILWEEFIRKLVRWLADNYNPIFVLFGTSTWGLDEEISDKSKQLKYHHPTDKDKSMINYRCFDDINIITGYNINWKSIFGVL